MYNGLHENKRGDEKEKLMKRKIQLILRYFKGAKKYFLAAVIASLITTVFNALTPQIFRFTIDSVLEGNDYPYLAEHLWIMALILVCVALLKRKNL